MNMHFPLRFVILLLSSPFAMVVTAQNYYAIKTNGELPPGYYLDKVYDADKTILLNQPSSQAMSSQNLIPFNFYFYRSQTPVNSYRVSENGYLTFDPLAFNAEVPDTSMPDQSIVAFGCDFKLQKLPAPNDGVATQVFAYTVGQAPRRSHVIQYYGLTLASDPLDKPITNASIYAFAIILHEGPEGRFDIVFTPFGNKNTKGIIGCSSDSGRSKMLLNDSVNTLPLQYSFQKSDFIVYQFRYGIQPRYDLALKELNVSSIYPVNAVVNFSGRLSNWGKEPVSSFKVNYAVNGGDTVSHLIDQVSLLPGGQGNMNFSHPISWTGGLAGSLSDVNFWLSDPNGEADGDSLNSHFSKTVLRNNNNSDIDRSVLLEEGTGAWCGYCPDAHLEVTKAAQLHGRRVIPVAYHFDDSMSNPDGNAFLSRYFSSYPDAQVDRRVYLGSNNTWASEIAARLNVKAPVIVTVENRTFEPISRTVSYRVRVKFTDYWYGSLRIGSIVTEDNVRGNADPNNWSQSNYYSRYRPGGGAGGSTHPLYDELEIMHGYIHRHVHKASPGGVFGVAGIIPALVAPGQEYFADFSYVLPEASFVSYDTENNTPYCSTLDGPGNNEGRNIPARLQLIGYVSEFDEDPLKCHLLNAASEPLWNLTSLNNADVPGPDMKVFPNPAGAEIRVVLQIPPGTDDLKTEILNAMGQVMITQTLQEVNEGELQLFINTSLLSPGLYHVRVSSGSNVGSGSVLIVR